MSPPGRPKGEYRSAQHEGSPDSPPGRPKGEAPGAQHEGSSASSPRAAATAFEPEFAAALRHLFEERIVFNKVLGLQITAVAPEGVAAHLEMRPELIGHYGHHRLHGGVISATLDALGGLAVMAALGARHLDEPPAARMGRFARLGTIDLRVDYLRQAIGPHFTARAQALRIGSRVASTRMEFFGADGELLATGAAAYIVS